MTPTRILVIETADPSGGVLVTDADGKVIAAPFAGPNQHAQRLTQQIADALPFPPADLDAIFVDRGPGSHTGVRIGLACARVISWQTGAPCFGVCSLDALAEAVPSAAVGAREIVAVVPCRGGMVYARRYSPATANEPVTPIAEPEIVDVRHEIPAEWHGGFVIGEGIAKEKAIRTAIANGDLHTAENLPGWPPLDCVLAVGRRESAALDMAQWPATMSPMYLAPALAKTTAERHADGTTFR